jgi:hypothetical protein
MEPLPAAPATPSALVPDADLNTVALHEQIRQRRWTIEERSHAQLTMPGSTQPSVSPTANADAEPQHARASATRNVLQTIAGLAAFAAAWAFLLAKISNSPNGRTSLLPAELLGSGLAACLLGYTGYRAFRRSWTGCWAFVALLFVANAVGEYDKKRQSGAVSYSSSFSEADLLRLRDRLASIRESLQRVVAAAGGQETVAVAIAQPMIILLDQCIAFADAEARWIQSAGTHESVGSMPSKADLQHARGLLGEMERLSSVVSQGAQTLLPSVRKRLIALGMAAGEVENEVQMIAGDFSVDEMMQQHMRILRKVSLDRIALDMKIGSYGRWRMQGGTVSFDSEDVDRRYAANSAEIAVISKAIEQWNRAQIASDSK